MNKAYSPILCLQLFAVVAGQTTFAADSKTENQPSMLDEVLVTANRDRESIRSVTANATIINREDIEQSPATTLGDLLAESSIGHIQKYPGNLTSVGIRGFRTDTHGNDLQGHVLILLDGRRAGTGNLAKIMTNNIQRVEIIRGPGAVQYGSAGMGGVINVITRRGTDNSMSVEAGGGSSDTAEGGMGGTLFTGNLDFAGSYSYGSHGDYETGDGTPYHNSGINYETGMSANLGYSFNETNRLAVIFTRFNVDEAGNPGYLSQNDLDDYSDKENYSVDMNFAGQCPVTGTRLLARYFFGKDENSWTDPVASNPTGWDMGTPATNRTEQQGTQLQLSNTIGPIAFTGGFDWLDYEVKNSWAPNTTDYANPALFLLSKASFLEDTLTANIGLRYDWYDVEVKEPTGRKADASHFTPQIGVAWMATDNVKIRAQYGEAFMMPSADQMAADFTSFGSPVLGNPDLAPEQSSTCEGGIDFSRNGLDASLTYFATDFEGKIVSTFLADGSKSWKNLGDATISGVEAELAYDIGAPMNLAWEIRPYFNITILDSYEDDRTGEDLQYVSGSNYSLGLVINNGEGFSCRLNVAYAGSQNVTDYESGYPYQEVKLASNSVTGLSLSWRVYELEQIGALTLRGEVRNIFDEEYAYVKGYPMPGREMYAGLRWDF